MIKVFDLTKQPAGRPYEYSREGRVLGWGLRNDVGVAEEPLTGGIYSVENSMDDISRDGVDVHTDNPGEELNYFGSLSDPVPAQPPNYGYPDVSPAPKLLSRLYVSSTNMEFISVSRLVEYKRA
jgi:hypothetical protein